MLASGEKEPHGLESTPFDIARIEDMDVGGKVESETGTFTVLRYAKEYLLLETKGGVRKFASLRTLKAFLVG